MADQGPLVFTDPDNEQIKLADNVELHFGSGADAQDESLYDIAMRWDGTDFDILQSTANSSIKLGVDGAGIDLVLYGDTASAAATWDQSADSLILSGGAILNVPAGQLQIASTAIDATALEINRTCDVSTRLVSVGGASLAITVAAHDGKIVKLDHTAATSTCTLPDATGTGAVFRFIVTAVNTNNHVIKVPDASNVFKGSVNILDNDANAQTAYAASGTDDTLTLNGTTTGGQIGDWVEFVDIAADTWAVRGDLVVPAGSNVADPFSATV